MLAPANSLRSIASTASIAASGMARGPTTSSLSTRMPPDAIAPIASSS